MSRVALLCEVMHAPFDEGIRIFAAGLARALAHSHETLLVSSKGSALDGVPIHGLLTDRWFLSRELARALAAFDPNVVIYVPWTSLTSRTLARAAILRRRARHAKVAVAALQPRRVGPLMMMAARAGAPDLVAVVGPGAESQARRLHLRVARIPAGVDLARFAPASPEQRAELKRRAGIDPGRYVVLHVGHMKRTRNVGVMERLARVHGVTCVLVASSSTAGRRDLAERLAAAGVIVASHHQDRIEFAYRMADAYLFPVVSELDAIELPLSVLEAAACDLSIVSTPFGGLPDLLSGGVTWARNAEEMEEAVRKLAAGGPGGAPAGTRRAVASLSWERAASRLLEALDVAGGGA